MCLLRVPKDMLGEIMMRESKEVMPNMDRLQSLREETQENPSALQLVTHTTMGEEENEDCFSPAHAPVYMERRRGDELLDRVRIGWISDLTISSSHSGFNRLQIEGVLGQYYTQYLKTISDWAAADTGQEGGHSDVFVVVEWSKSLTQTVGALQGSSRDVLLSTDSEKGFIKVLETFDFGGMTFSYDLGDTKEQT